MNPFRSTSHRPVAAGRGYAWTAARNERALGFLIWTAFFCLLLAISG